MLEEKHGSDGLKMHFLLHIREIIKLLQNGSSFVNAICIIMRSSSFVNVNCIIINSSSFVNVVCIIMSEIDLVSWV
jgi:hypothetical protein